MPWANDATAQMGMQFGKSAVMAGSDYVERNFTKHLPVAHLQNAFNVSNLYVLKKLRLVLFPWRHVRRSSRLCLFFFFLNFLLICARFAETMEQTDQAQRSLWPS